MSTRRSLGTDLLIGFVLWEPVVVFAVVGWHYPALIAGIGIAVLFPATLQSTYRVAKATGGKLSWTGSLLKRLGERWRRTAFRWFAGSTD